MKENDREQELPSKKVAKIQKERPRPRARKEATSVVLNTEQCRELNRVSARERRWSNTEQCREAVRVRALEKNWNARKFDSEDYRTLRVEMWCAAVQAEKSHDFIRTNERNQTCFASLEVLQEGKYIEKICSVQSPQLLLEVLPTGVVNCRIVVSDFVTWGLLCFPYELFSYPAM